MTRSKPPFRADVVGSLLRTAPLKEARARRERGEISGPQLKEVEDREIEKIIKKQEEAGLRLAPNAVDTKVYADRDAIFEDLARTYQQAIRAFYDAGCRYLQFDDTVWA